MTLPVLIDRTLVLITILFVQTTLSCSQNRTYLTEQEKRWNPYKDGQVLIFRTEDGRTDSLEITNVDDKRFPDGIGALTNERLRVSARVERPSMARHPIEIVILSISARTVRDKSEIDFEIFIADGGFWSKPRSIDNLEAQATMSFQTSYGAFDDVIRIDYNDNQPLRGSDIGTIFWSRTGGYIRCIKNDGTVWELVEIL